MAEERARKARTMRATLGSKLIPNAASMFRGDLEGKISEVVQNARRAGATRISFTRKGADLAVVDDGAGLAAEDAELLLAMGASRNGRRVEEGEAAAGIGFFALGHHVVRVRSHDWGCTITPEAFKGLTAVEIEEGLPDVYGMELVIEGIARRMPAHLMLRGERAADALERILLEATLHSGMTATVDVGTTSGASVQEPVAFLDRHRERERYAETAVRRLPGLEVKAVRFLSAGEEDAADYDRALRLNFHGKAVKVEIPFEREIEMGLEGLDSVETIDDAGRPTTDYYRVCVLVDVTATTTVRLRLPDRDAVLDDEGLEALLTLVGKVRDELLEIPLLAIEGAGFVASKIVEGVGKGSTPIQILSGAEGSPQVRDDAGCGFPLASIAVAGEDPSLRLLPHAWAMADGSTIRMFSAGDALEEAFDVKTWPRALWGLRLDWRAAGASGSEAVGLPGIADKEGSIERSLWTALTRIRREAGLAPEGRLDDLRATLAIADLDARPAIRLSVATPIPWIAAGNLRCGADEASLAFLATAAADPDEILKEVESLAITHSICGRWRKARRANHRDVYGDSEKVAEGWKIAAMAACGRRDKVAGLVARVLGARLSWLPTGPLALAVDLTIAPGPYGNNEASVRA